MPIDWFTVVAQAINFLILVWLLKRFLYKPILDAIDNREKGIATQLATVEATKAAAQKERDDFQHKNETFDQERAGLMTKASDDAKVERQRLFDEARKVDDSLRAKRQVTLQNEQRDLNQEICRRLQHEVFAMTRKTLAELANASLEACIVEAFINRLRTLGGPARDQLMTAARTSTQLPRVRTAFDLPQPQRDAIEIAVKETFATEAQIQFETMPDLAAGIEVSTNGQKLAWSVTDYLSILEKSVGELLQEDVQSISRPDTEATSPGANANRLAGTVGTSSGASK